MSQSESKAMLDLAARVALRGMGRVEPNPTVGAVIAREGRILGIGHHRFVGGPHAEAEALEACRRAGEDPVGSTLYVTLEPCAHQGRQPPCTEAIVRAGIARVVMACRDPHPVARGGAEFLRSRGVAVELDESSPFAAAVSAPFLKRVASSLPWVIAKWAQTIDGRVATRSGESKWISGRPARRRVHRLRGRVDAIVTGLGTVRSDDPLLTPRDAGPPRRVPVRVVVDPELEVWLDSRLVRTARQVPVVVACSQEALEAPALALKRTQIEAAGVRLEPLPPGEGGLDLRELFLRLHSGYGVSTVLVEAGPILLGSLLQADLVDMAVVYIAPIMLADEQAKGPAIGRIAESLKEGRGFELLRVRPLGPDIEALYRRRPAQA
jgi:diaminohydroxyphosphoribosylaminopyrimidine deaminase/5-amino-6-(5-phosphoribosylamino)uracil reductase